MTCSQSLPYQILFPKWVYQVLLWLFTERILANLVARNGIVDSKRSIAFQPEGAKHCPNSKLQRMKLSFFSLLVLAIVSCDTSSVDLSSINGTWKLSEVLADPGDGSGTFHSVSSSKKILFFQNGTFVSNSNICQFSTSTAGSSAGTFSLTSNTIEPANCSNSYPFTLDLVSNELIISYQCFEACREKYRKVSGNEWE